MNLLEIKKMIKENDGDHLYPIYIPSLGREVYFRPITAGQMKSLAKMNIEHEDSSSIINQTRLALLDEISDDELDILKLTDVDFVVILAGIRANNFIDPITFVVTCLNGVEKECGADINVVVDFNCVCANARKAKIHSDVTIQMNDKGIDFEVVLGRPYMVNVIELSQYIKVSSNKLSDLYVNNMLQYIKEVKVNGESIGNFSMLSFADKQLVLSEVLPLGLVYGDEKSIKSTVRELFTVDDINQLFQVIRCPKCRDLKEGMITLDDFFTL